MKDDIIPWDIQIKYMGVQLSINLRWGPTHKLYSR